ncbi:MAG: hypothetical protein JSR47_16670 [Proteobacteria bacterium]|nr:hypothetical protein [Pseudomonadota bacterium]MBS0548211.1 hypothetical protein [Pseudomonadota bacterium]
MPDPWTLLAFLLNSGLHWLLALGGVVILLMVIGHVLLALLLVIPTWRICVRAGFSGALSLLHFVPFVGSLVVMAILAFSDWPAGEADQRNS